ncbi:MAG: alpha-(1-_3)-arabinofuranosyltransferase family protein [Candidatus Bathyarchaeota archaeon]|nr:alpha-(1->3)-arabinofuranosyltransferase family protein [Candidatus Bathyarchaeota archaeon]
MKKFTVLQIAIIFFVGLIPLLWLQPGYIISNGDNIPPSLNADKTFSSSTNMWSPDYLGYASPNPSYLLNTYFAAVLSEFGVSVSVIQILIQVLLYMGAGFCMYFFSKTIYPERKLAPIFASLFYMLNFFVLSSRFNIGFAWTYTFLPLILALFVRIVDATYRQDKRLANINTVLFALFSVLALSVASISPANIALFLFALSAFAIYYIIKYRKQIAPFLFAVGKTIAVTIPVNVWWIYPMLNTFIFSPTALNPDVNIVAWSWTHSRSSFLNLFWFNGVWGWLPEYVPYIKFYSNPIVIVLTFVPFLAAGLALLFKSNKSRLNAYLMLTILVFIFLAKGLHEPLGDGLLYEKIPLFNMFREPASKFTLLVIPFVALLIGYLADSIANLKLNIKPKVFKAAKATILLFLVTAFVVSSFPIFMGSHFADTKTEQLPYSSYVQIPQYWYQATEWINNQPGDWKILLTPLNDFYEMPYEWGYYGTDQLLERLFEKPIVSTVALNGYVTNANTSAILKQIRASVKFNRTDEFKTLLDVLSIKYIVQRNDVKTNMEGRNLRPPSYMQAFFAQQPYLKLIKTYGEIDIYEYTEAKPSIYAISPDSLQKINIQIGNSLIMNKTWSSLSPQEFQDWLNSNNLTQSQQSCIINQKDNRLQVTLYNVTNGWVTVNSPVLPVESETSYEIYAALYARNNSQLIFQVAEYSDQMTLLCNSTVSRIDLQDFDNYELDYTFEPTNIRTKYFNIKLWSQLPHETSQSVLMVNNISITGIASTLNMTGAEHLYPDDNRTQPTQILHFQNVTPQKTIVTVNTTQPFILATTQQLDRFWVAHIKGQAVKPISLYLGLKGFEVEQTGQFDITIEYQPQTWFEYCSVISAATVLLLCISLLYLNKTSIKQLQN